MKYTTLLLGLLLVIACGTTPPKTIHPKTGMGSCAVACDKLVRLGCVPEKTPDGHPCSEVCEYLEAGNVSWHTDCIVSPDVTTCGDVDRCRSMP